MQRENSTESQNYLICKKHQKYQRKSEKYKNFMKNTFVCINRYCPNAFELSCIKCKSQFHKDHVIKFVTLDNFKGLLTFFGENDFRKINNDGYEMFKKLKLIKDFRRKIQFIEVELTSSLREVISYSNQIQKEQFNSNKLINEYGEEFDNLLNNNFEEFSSRIKNIGQHIDYNTKKDMLELNYPKLKELEDKRRKLFESCRKEIQEIKQYSMKIIEVILHQNESDDEQETFVLKKKLSLIKEDTEATNNDQESKKLYRDGIKQLLEQMDVKSEELEKWIKKISVYEPEILTEYEHFEYVKCQQRKQQILTLQKSNDDYANQVKSYKNQIEDLRRKIARMKKQEEDKINKVKLEIHQNCITQEFLLNKINQITEKIRAEYNSHLSTTEVNQKISQTTNSYQDALRKEKQQNQELLNKEKQQYQVLLNKEKQQKITLQQTLAQEKRKNQQIENRIKDTEQKLAKIIENTEVNNEKWIAVNNSKNATITNLMDKVNQFMELSKRKIKYQNKVY